MKIPIASRNHHSVQRGIETGGFGFISFRARGCTLPLLDQLDHPRGGLLDRELSDVQDGTTEPAVDRVGVLQLVVDLDQLRVRLRVRLIWRTRSWRISA